MTEHIISVRTNLVVFGVLMLLLVLTVGIAYVDLGPLNFPMSMAIASVKTVLIMLYFMHVRYSNRLTWVFSTAAFFWLGILIVLTLSDYLTRGWLRIPGK